MGPQTDYGGGLMNTRDLPDFACEHCLETHTPCRLVEVHPPGTCRVCGGLTEDPWTREQLEDLLRERGSLPPLERTVAPAPPEQRRLL